MVGPRLTGAPHGASVELLSATQMLYFPKPPGRSEVNYRVRPLGETQGARDSWPGRLMGAGNGAGVANIQFSAAATRLETPPARSTQAEKQSAQWVAGGSEWIGGFVVVFISLLNLEQVFMMFFWSELLPGGHADCRLALGQISLRKLRRLSAGQDFRFNSSKSHARA